MAIPTIRPERPGDVAAIGALTRAAFASAPLTLAGVPPAYFQAIDLGGARPAGAVRYHPSFAVTA